MTGSEGLGCPPGTVAPRALGRGGAAPLSGLGCGLGHPCSCPKRHPPGRRPCQEASEKAQRPLLSAAAGQTDIRKNVGYSGHETKTSLFHTNTFKHLFIFVPSEQR